MAEFAAVLTRGAMLSIPTLPARPDDVPRPLEVYGMEAADALSTTWLGLWLGDMQRVLDSGITTLDQFEVFALRLVALHLVVLRNWGGAENAKRLGVTHGALSCWARRWKLSGPSTSIVGGGGTGFRTDGGNGGSDAADRGAAAGERRAPLQIPDAGYRPGPVLSCDACRRASLNPRCGSGH